MIKDLSWLVWLSLLGITPQTKMLPVQFLVRAHMWVAGLVPSKGVCKRQQINVLAHINVSLPLLLPPFPLSKTNLKNLNKDKRFMFLLKNIESKYLYV